MNNDIKLEIKWNNCSISHERCTLCGEPDRAMVGPELFVGKDWQRVCLACGERHSPRIVAKLKELQQQYLGEWPGEAAWLEATAQPNQGDRRPSLDIDGAAG